MDLRQAEITKKELLLLLLGLIALIALLLVNNRPPFYDEDEYLKNVLLLNQYGFTEKYLLEHLGSAGPLYSVTHYVLEPFTELRAPYIRFVNIALLLGSIYFTGLTLKLLSFSQKFAWQILAIPMTYVISGLALTEMPAIFFLSAGIYLIAKSTCKDAPYLKLVVQLAFGGLFLSLAILGRQPFLLILPALSILFFNPKNLIRSGSLLLITILFSLALPCYTFFVWNGLVAPSDAVVYSDIANEGVTYRPIFFFLCLAYFAVIFSIIAPYFYIKPGKKELLFLLLFFALFIFLNYQFEFILFLPFQFLLDKIFPSNLIKYAQIVCGALLLLSSLFFLLTILRQLHRNNYKKELLFFTTAILLIAISCIKITWGFSSRYPAQAISLVIPVCAYFYRRSRFNVYRIGVGVVLGLVSFASYMILAK